MLLNFKQSNVKTLRGESLYHHNHNTFTGSGLLAAEEPIVLKKNQLIELNKIWPWEKGDIKNIPTREVLIRTPGKDFQFQTDEHIPANLLKELNIVLFPHDRVLVNGIPVDPNLPLDGEGFTFIQFEPAKNILLLIDGDQVKLFTDQPTLGAALENASIFVGPQDWISESLLRLVDDNLAVTIRRAKPITVSVGERFVTGLTAAVTVGEALSDIGITPQNVDRTVPAEDEPLPENREVKLIQGSEQVIILTDETPYQNEYVEDPNTELDQISVVNRGQVGIFATRERVQFSDGVETWRDTPETWQASEVVDGVLGYGTLVKVRTAVVDGQEIEYWRKISVYANSYSPCRIGIPGKCGYGTASGLPMGNGIIAVTRNWFNAMKFQRVFVQGYGFGTIADVGGGANYFDHYWIDLGFTDDTYQSWHHWTTMYFLTPIPAWYPTVLTWP